MSHLASGGKAWGVLFALLIGIPLLGAIVLAIFLRGLLT